MPVLTDASISSGFAVTLAEIVETSRSTIIYINMIAEVAMALPNFVTKL